MAEQLIVPVPLRKQMHGLQAMAAYIETVRDQPHIWGQRDCWTFVRDGLRLLGNNAAFGADIPAYTDAAGARQAFQRALQGRTMTEYGAAWHLFAEPRSQFAFAASGDLLVWQRASEALPHFGLVLGRTVWECTVDHGVIGWPLLAGFMRLDALDAGLTIHRMAVA